MNRILLISAVFLLLSIAGGSAWAQPGAGSVQFRTVEDGQSPSVLTYRKVLDRNFWNDSYNVSGMRQDSVSRSVAYVYGGFTSGGFRQSYEADTQWNAGARAASIKHLNNFSLSGEFGFEQFWGYGMSGSMFTRPGYYPFDILEFTPGPKTRQLYTARGALSVDVAPHWRIGALMDLGMSNYSKRKDLRHTNYRCELTFAPGVQYHSGSFAAGASYIYFRNTESLNAEQIGSSVSGYDAFFDKGLYYGAGGLWTGSGIHLDEVGVSGFPVCENVHGLSLQASLGDLYADVSWRSRYAVAGEKQCIWFRFPGWDLGAHLGWRFRSVRGVHSFRLIFDMLDQSNYETVLDKVTSGGITTFVEHGANLIFRRVSTRSALDYRFESRIWEFSGCASLYEMDSESGMTYPYIARQRLLSPTVQGSAMLRAGSFDLSLGLLWGQGAIRDDLRVVDEGSGVQGTLQRLDEYYYMYKDYMTSYRFTLTPAVRYNFPSGIYVEASGNWTRALNIRHLPGNFRAVATVSAGYNF